MTGRTTGGRAEAGMTVVELTITMALLSVVMAIFTSVLIVVQQTVTTTTERSLNNDEVRLAVEQIDRQVRSGNILYDPTPDGMNVVIYTQSNFPTEGYRCMQWQVTGRTLQSRSWVQGPLAPTSVTPWRTVANRVANLDDPPTPAFVLENSPSQGRLLTIRILTSKSAGASSVEVKAAVNGRNTQYGYPPLQCRTVPPS